MQLFCGLSAVDIIQSNIWKLINFQFPGGILQTTVCHPQINNDIILDEVSVVLQHQNVK